MIKTLGEFYNDGHAELKEISIELGPGSISPEVLLFIDILEACNNYNKLKESKNEHNPRSN